MATFRIINNTSSSLPLSTSETIAPGALRIVGQVTLEMRRLESAKLLTIQVLPMGGGNFVDDPLLPDYPGTVDPTPNTGGTTGELTALLPALDGSVPEYQAGGNEWQATVSPRRLILDGGNF